MEWTAVQTEQVFEDDHSMSPEPSTSSACLNKIKTYRKCGRSKRRYPKTNLTYCCKLRKASNGNKAIHKQVPKHRNRNCLINHETIACNLQTYDTCMSKFCTVCQRAKQNGFSLDEKMKALTSYKLSGVRYKFLVKEYGLPPRKSVKNLLNKFSFDCGTDYNVYKHLKQTVDDMESWDKYCTLMFDTIPLKQGLYYNPKLDFIEGFVDYGRKDRRLEFADRAFVLMARGLYKKWHQVVGFCFCNGSTKTDDLMKILKETIQELRQTGLCVVASISNQAVTNQRLINRLFKDTKVYCKENNIENKYQGYLVNGEEVVHLFSFPHLLKNIRNNLLTRDLHFTTDGTEKTASWCHIQKLYEIDLFLGINMLYKYTSRHFIPKKISKNNIRHALQVFSQTVASRIHWFATTVHPNKNLNIDPKGIETAELVMILDQLIDSLNGLPYKVLHHKPLRRIATNKTKHVTHWTSAIDLFKTMYFTTPNSTKKIITHSLTNWIFSLQSLIYLWYMLMNKNLTYLATRRVNLDALENYFARVRSCDMEKPKPTCSSFAASHKVLLVDNRKLTHPYNSKCDTDRSEQLLKTLREFVKKQVKNSNTYRATARKCKSIAVRKSDCFLCKTFATSENAANIKQNIMNQKKRFKTLLTHPSSEFSSVYKQIVQTVLDAMPNLVISYQIRNTLFDLIERDFIDRVSRLFCQKHQNNVDRFISVTTHVALCYYLHSINGILKGKRLNSAKNSRDPIKQLAFNAFSNK